MMDALAICVRSNFAGTEGVKMYSEVSSLVTMMGTTARYRALTDRPFTGLNTLSKRTFKKSQRALMQYGQLQMFLSRRKEPFSERSIKIMGRVHCVSRVVLLLDTTSKPIGP